MESRCQLSPRRRPQVLVDRPRTLPLLGILALASFGGACGVHDWVKQRCVERVAAEIDSRNPVATTLAVQGNPKGEGLVVFSKSEGCGPKFMWVTISDADTFKVYAVDAASQTLTPRLALLTNAPLRERDKLGADAESFGRVIRDEFCRTKKSSHPSR
jgi:hypothetical protein